MAQPIITRESDGLRFEPAVQPGMVRCECCMQLVEPSKVREHRCLFVQLTEIWPGETPAEGLATFRRLVQGTER